ncbi:MAG: hypothetical protein AAF355_15510 [Myxococcota bacterium]
MPQLRPIWACLYVLFLTSACGDDTSTSVGGDGGVSSELCVPDEASFDTVALPVITSRCSQCHGDPPQFGAPFSLLEYDPLVVGSADARIVDRIALRVSEGTMPPVGAAQPTVEERNTLVQWASCGDETVGKKTGTIVNREPFVSPGTAPSDALEVDLTAGEFEVGANLIDDYQEFFFDGIVDRELFVQRLEAIVDESQVIHHLTLERARQDGAMRYLYTWAPGTGAFQFPDGGVRIRPTDQLRLEIHYNNGTGERGVRDSSGVRLFLGEPGGTEYLMADPGPGTSGWTVAPRSEGSAESTCEVSQSVQVLATMPHMHEIGDYFEILVDGQTELRLDGWSFENQLFYQFPLELNAGQELTVRCGFFNPGSTTVTAGLRTEDEMCFAFTYITPALEDFCL